jgi:hypothetical protein
VHIFTWKLLQQRLPTRKNFVARNILPAVDNLNCIFCFDADESDEHLFFQCQISASFAKFVSLGREKLKPMFSTVGGGCMIYMEIWNARNNIKYFVNIHIDLRS